MSSSDNPTLNEMEVSEPTEKSLTNNSSRLVKAREKPVDKRKAPKKDDSFGDADLSSQKTPMKKLKTSTTAIGNVEMKMEKTELLKDDESNQLEPLSESAEASLLRTTVEGDDNSQIKGKDKGSESGDSKIPDKFYSQIEEMKDKGKSLSISPVLEYPGLAAISPISDGPDNKNAAVASRVENKKSARKRKRSSSRSLESLVLPATKPVHVYMKILDPTTNRLIYETKGDWIMSQFGTVKTFLSDHQVEISSKLSGSGYSADISSQNLSSGPDDFSKPRQVSSGSAIPRPSDASTVNPPSINPANGDSMTQKGRGRGGGRGRGRGRGGRQYKPNKPAFSSTMVLPNVESTSTSNGEDHSNGIKAIVNMETPTSSGEQTTVLKPKRKSTPRRILKPVVKTEQKEGVVVASVPHESAGDRDASTPTPVGGKTPTGRGRRGLGSSEDTDDKYAKSQQKTPDSLSDVSGDKSKTTSTSAAKDTPKQRGTKRSKKLFQGIQFFFTACGGTFPAGKTAPLEPYDREEFHDLVKMHGGSVVDQVGRENRKGKGKKVFLISDNFARTVKYIYALAAGIRCVSYKWITECIKADNMVDYKEFELESGQSLETGAAIPAHNQKPLRGVKMYVTAESEELFNYWKPILLAAGVNLVKAVKAKGKKAVLIPPGTEILVTDPTCDDDVLEFAEKAGIPFVRPEWLVQTIITGKKVDFAGHIKYSVTAEESEDEETNDN